jgi:hypothetical protein
VTVHVLAHPLVRRVVALGFDGFAPFELVSTAASIC